MSEIFQSALDRENPWPGLAPFTEAQSAQFFGRDAEIKTLARRVQGDPLTVLFGQSGLGKSSLLQAGVFPRLRSADFCPVYLRLDHSAGAPSLTEQVKAIVSTATATAGRWTRPGAAGPSLWEFFHHRDNRLVSPGGIALSPVLVFDQFEELFTLGGASGAERQRAVAFMTELAELVENRPPEALVARVEASPAELDALDFGATDYRVVITLREDYLPHLESLKTIMPTLMDNRMRLTRMNGVQALEAVVKPGAGLVSDEVARAIVEFVSGARGGSTERLAELDVEPPLLSIICRELNERRRAAGAAQITADLVTGNRREILTDFYERSVADLPEAMRTFVEDHLLTKSGFRDNLSLESALDFPGVTRPLIATLVDRRLVRTEDRLGVERVELTHDVLAEVIRTSRDTHHQKLEVEQVRERERVTRRRMWLARTIAAALLVGLTGVSWIAWRAIRAEREQTHLRADADMARTRADALRVKAEADELAALRKAYASDMNGVQAALAVDNLGRARALLDRHRPAPGELDLRGWEWRYLWQFCQSDATAVLKEPNDNSIISFAVSGDGSWLAAGGLFGGELFVLNLATKEKIKVPAGAGNVRVAFSPREPLLAIGIDDRERGISLNAANPPLGRMLLWDATLRKIVREIPLTGVCNAVAFSSDGQTLATVNLGRENTISLWRVADGAQIASWPGGSGVNTTVTGFATTPDLNFAAFPFFGSLGNGGVRVLDLKTGRERCVIDTISYYSGVALSPDGAMLATTPGSMAVDSTIQLWEVATGREIGRLDGHRGRVGQLFFLPDGKQLVSASADQTVRLWDVGTRTAVRTFRGHKTEVWRVQLMSDQRTLVSGSKDGSVYHWNLQAGRETSATWTLARGTGGAWAFAGGGEFIVNVDRQGRVTRRQGRTYQEEKPILEVGPLFSRGRTDTTAVFDQRRPLLAVATDGDKVQVWDWERRQLVREFPGLVGSQRVAPQRFAQDGTSLAVRLSTGRELFAYREWEIATGHERRSFDFALTPSTRFTGTFSPDGTKFARLIYPEGEGQLFDLQSGRTTPLKLNVREPVEPGFSADGGLLAVPSLQSSLRIFDVAANREVAALGGYMFGVHAATISPDGKRFVSGGTGVEAVALWDAQSHERLLTLAAKTSALSSVEFSPDGNVLLGGGSLGGGTQAPSMLHFWRAPSWAEIEQAEAAERAVAGR